MATICGARRVKRIGVESAMFRVIPAFESFRRTVSRVYAAFIAHLFRPFRATDLGGRPLTQGGASRLRRDALPWAILSLPLRGVRTIVPRGLGADWADQTGGSVSISQFAASL